MRRIMITIKGTQSEGDNNELIEFVTEGRFCRLSDGYLLEYEESALTGINGCTTKLTLKNDSVILQRSGSIDTHMVFSPGSVFSGFYSTPGGTMNLSVYPLRIESRLGEDDGSLNLEYEMTSGEMFTQNKLSLSFKQMKDSKS
ncbi:MAG: DUF1934 domain-containing protein [Christensenellales bacterium]